MIGKNIERKIISELKLNNFICHTKEKKAISLQTFYYPYYPIKVHKVFTEKNINF